MFKVYAEGNSVKETIIKKNPKLQALKDNIGKMTSRNQARYAEMKRRKEERKKANKANPRV